MNLTLLIYLAGVSENLQVLLILGSIFGGLAYTAACVITRVERTAKPAPLWLLPVFVLTLIIGAMLPDRSTIYTMMAAQGVEAAAANPQVQQLAGDSMKLLEQTIHKYLKDQDKKEDK